MVIRKRPPLPLGQWFLKAAAAVVLGFLIAPALIVVPLSFGGDVMTRFPPKHFSLEAYSRFLNGPGWLDAALFSLEGATIVMLAAIVIGTLTAFGVARSKGRTRSIVATLVGGYEWELDIVALRPDPRHIVHI
jgi:ABC-type spermidine/putrescine transport system permease subunit II